MQTFHATIDYETKKGNLKTAMIDVEARDLDAATRKAQREVRTNKLRRVRRITTTRVVPARTFNSSSRPPARNFFARLFGRG